MFRRTLWIAGLLLAVSLLGYRIRQRLVVHAAGPPTVESSHSASSAGSLRDHSHALIPTAGATRGAEEDVAGSSLASEASSNERFAERFESEIRLRVFFGEADLPRTENAAPGAEAQLGDSASPRWRDSAVPARGRLQFSMKDVQGRSAPLEVSAELDQEGIAVMTLPEEWAVRFGAFQDAIEVEASLVVAPGLEPIAAEPLGRTQIFEVVELAFSVPRGVVVDGRIAGVGADGQGAVAHLIPGRVAAADLAEWTGGPRLRSHRSRQELLRFEPEAETSIALRPDGSFGPLWLPEAQGAAVAVSGPRGFGSWRGELPAGLAPGDRWSLGPVELHAPTALELRVHASGASVPAGCRLLCERAPGDESDDFGVLLRAIDSKLATFLLDGVEGGPILEPGEGGRVRLAPLPPNGGALSLRVVLPDGSKSSSLHVDLVPEQTTQVEIDLSEHFAVEALRGVCVDGRVLWEDGEPAQGVLLAHAGLGRAAEATTDADGRFRIEGLALGREHAFRLTEWDARSPQRDRWRLATFEPGQETPFEGAECAHVEWRLERPRYLLARGLELPEGAFSGLRPKGWVLQEQQAEGGWTSYPLEEAEWLDHGSRSDVRVPLPSASTGSRRLRLVAIWGPLLHSATHPIELHPRGPFELTTSFETRELRPAVSVSGLAYDAEGEALAGVEVHALSRWIECAPKTVRTDRYGGFQFQDVRVDELQLYVVDDRARGEARLDPRVTTFAELRTR